VTETKAQITRDKIMREASRLFRDHGYSGTTMRAIARRCGVKAGSIYYHFSSKETLIDAILEVGLEDVTRAVRKAVDALPATASSRDRIGVAIEAQLRALIDIGEYAIASRRVIAQIPARVRNKHLRLREQFAAYWHTMFLKAQQAGEISPELDIRLCRLFIMGAINGSVEWFNPQVKSIGYVAGHFVRMSVGIFDADNATAAVRAKRRVPRHVKRSRAAIVPPTRKRVQA
jgi:TetR/AcrR family transcriptional regulator, cholesterol catabolism regulator